MTARRAAAAPDRDETTESRKQGGLGYAIDARSKAAPTATYPVQPGATALAQGCGSALSNRALNVLKILAAEITGECPPRARWMPSPALLREITYKHLVTARNCGPQTVGEIIRWARGRRG
jgi:hypothetical protein